MNAPDGWLNPLQIARLDPPRMHCNSMLGLSRRLTHIPMNAPHWAHVFTVLISGYIVVTTDGETTSPGLPSLRMPSQIWETLKKWLVAYVGHSDLEVAARRATVAARIVSDILDFSEEVIETRQETRQGWFSGKAFMDLLDFWVDVSRKVCILRLGFADATEPYSIECGTGDFSHVWIDISSKASLRLSSGC